MASFEEVSNDLRFRIKQSILPCHSPLEEESVVKGDLVLDLVDLPEDEELELLCFVLDL